MSKISTTLLCQIIVKVHSLSSETKTEDNSASAHKVSLSGAACDGSDGDKLGGLLVNKVHVMHT